VTTITTINAEDNISDSRTDINTNFSNLNTDKVETSVIDTDTTLAANSDAKIPSQKAVKAYVDTLGNVNASTTARGIVEEATQAEIATLSASGGTGARLFINPSTAGSFLGIKSITAGATINGATLPVPVYQKKSDNEFYACDANDTDAMKFLGFSITNGTDGAAMSVQFSGVVSGFTGLAEGEKYYVQDTVGTIGTTPGTYEILVGIAISETELLIQKGNRYMAGTITQADAGADETNTDTVITLGFRPSIIRMFTQVDAVGDTAGSSGIWRNGTYSTVRFTINESGSLSYIGTGNSFIVEIWTTAGSDEWNGTITNVTDTGFTLSMLQRVSNPQTAYILWEAEGAI
jgi:hypothetical protein